MRDISEYFRNKPDNNEETINLLTNILPHWARYFNKHALDHDWQLRDASFDALDKLAVKLRRKIAPNLKQIMPVWLVGQFDPCAPVARCAQKSFNYLFTREKQMEAILFCQNEILNHISSVIIEPPKIKSSTTDTSNVDSISQIRERHERLTVGCLGSLTMLINSYKENHKSSDSLIDETSVLRSILSNDKFWKLSKHTNYSVRNAFYNFLLNLVKKFDIEKLLDQGSITKLYQCTFGRITDQHVQTCESIWDTILFLSDTKNTHLVPWYHVNFQKAFQPQLFAAIKNNFNHKISSCLPTLIKNMKLDQLVQYNIDKDRFIIELFENLSLLMTEDSGSPSNQAYKITKSFNERHSAMRCLVECLAVLVLEQQSSETIETVSRTISEYIQQSYESVINTTQLLTDLTYLLITINATINELSPHGVLASLSNSIFSIIDNLVQFLTDAFVNSYSRKIEDEAGAREQEIFYQRCSDNLTLAIKSIYLSIRDPQNIEASLDRSLLIDYSKRLSPESMVGASKNLEEHLMNLGLFSTVTQQVRERCKQSTDAHSLRLFNEFMAIDLNLFAAGSLTITVHEIWSEISDLWIKNIDLTSSDQMLVQSKILVRLVDIASSKENYNNDKLSIFIEEIIGKFQHSDMLYSYILQEISESHINTHWLNWLMNSELFKEKLHQIAISVLRERASGNEESFDGDQDVSEIVTSDVCESRWLVLANCCRISSLHNVLSIVFKVWTDNLSKLEEPSQTKKVLEDLSTNIIVHVIEQKNFQKEIWPRIISKDFMHKLYIADCNSNTSSESLSRLVALSIPCDNQQRLILISECLLNIKLFILNLKSIEQAEHVVERIVNTIGDASLIGNDELNLYLEAILLSPDEWQSLIYRSCPYLLRHCFYKELSYLPELLSNIPHMDGSNEQAEFNTDNETSMILATLVVSRFLHRLTTCKKTKLAHIPWLLANRTLLRICKEARQQYGSLADSALKRMESSMPMLLDCFDLDDRKQVISELFRLSMEKGFPFFLTLDEVLSSNGAIAWAKSFNKEELEQLLLIQLTITNINVRQVIYLQFGAAYMSDSKLRDLLAVIVDKLVESEQLVTNYQTAYKINIMTNVIYHLRDRAEIFDIISPVLSMVNDLKLIQPAPSHLDELDLEDITFSLALNDFYRMCIAHLKEEMSVIEWDLVHVSIAKWIALMVDSKSQILVGVSKPIFATKVLMTIHDLICLAKNWQDKEEVSRHDFPLMQTLVEEWNELHSVNVYFPLLLIYFDLASRENLSDRDLMVVSSLARIVVNADVDIIWRNCEFFPNRESADDIANIQHVKECRFLNLPQNRRNGIDNLCHLFKSSHRIVIVSAHIIMTKLMTKIWSEVSEEILKDDQSSEAASLCLVPPASMISILIRKDSMVSTLLSDFRVGDVSIVIEQDTYSYTCTLSYFFIWQEILEFMSGLTVELKQQISTYLQEAGFVQRLLDNVFRLMPSITDCSATFKSDEEMGDFLRSAQLNLSLMGQPNEIEMLALHTYFQAARRMPVTVRQWYNNVNKRVSDLVNKYTTRYISPVICALEFDTVQERKQEKLGDDNFKNMTIKARPTAREVLAVYTLDEFSLELTIKLPVNYPLGPVMVDGGKRVGVSDLQWRNWLLRLTTFLTHQNGPILDGIELWKRNIDKRFEGLEECMICFSILYSNYQLPKLKCRHCTKMFHNTCLYKWFVTSSNSTCPLCRNLW